MLFSFTIFLRKDKKVNRKNLKNIAMRTKFNSTNLRVKIKYCWSKVPEYDNLKPGTSHLVLRTSGKGLVWVKGVTQPVVLFPDEFEFVYSRRTKTNRK